MYPNSPVRLADERRDIELRVRATPVPKPNPVVTLRIRPPVGTAADIQLAPEAVVPVDNAPGEYAVKASLPAALQSLRISIILNGDERDESIAWSITTPDNSQLEKLPSFAVSNNRRRATAAVTGDAPINIYGGYLSVSGRSANGTTIGAVLDQKVGGTFQRYAELAATRTSQVQSDWVYRVQVPKDLPDNFVGRVNLYVQRGDQFRFSSKPVDIQRANLPGATLEITSIQQNSETPKADRTPYYNSSDLKLTCRSTQTDFDGMLVLLSRNQEIEDTRFQIANAAANPILPWTIPAPGAYELRIGLVYGDTLLPQVSDSKTIRFRRAGPAPTRAEVAQASRTAASGVVRVTFDAESPLKAGSVDDSNFQLKRARSSDLIAINTVTIDPADGRYVDLKIDSGLEADDYTLVVKRTASDSANVIRDRYENPLGQGADGSDGRTEFTLTFSYGVESDPLTGAVVGDVPLTKDRSLKDFTGPNVEFPEYTDPRPSTNGFNPSDKVVSRVARLYYNRDAHRVAQLINRDARSYNRQAVTQQQQLADNARRDADNFTDERRATETQAIRAAQRARAAEDALLQAQQALTQSTTELQNLRGQLADGTNAIRDQRTELDRANANVASAQQRLEQAKAVTAEKKRLADDAAAAAKTTSAGKTTDTIESSSLSLTDRTSQTMTSATEFSTLEGPTQTVEQEAYAQAVRDQAAAERALNAALGAQSRQQQALQGAEDQLARMRQAQGDALARQQNSTRLVNVALGEVAAARETEVQKADQLQSRQAREDRAYDTLFRREVAAANEDPDTYAPGKPDSIDPVEQVSISVVGEGVIQLRGPIKGVNLARMQIHDLDAPVGQVKVAVHTVQVNGERGDRIEPVVERIQRYVDHSRFLTAQSAQMLRRAVTEVASRRAEMVFAECEGLSQYERDQRYIEAFFGQQFLAELRELDSEFLRTGNKILSLHSMDTTSLAQCLFLMSLAKNDIRMEILTEFERLVTCQLPMDEMEYFDASNARKKFGHLFHKQKFQFFAQNARFVSLRGMYQAEVAGPDTLTPMQREFIRLAQIFKSRLITEIEFKQRVMERAMIEDRFDNFSERMQRAARSDDAAQEELKTVEREVITARLTASRQIRSLIALINATVSESQQLMVEFVQASEQDGKSADRQTNPKSDATDLLSYLDSSFPETIEDFRKSPGKQWLLFNLRKYQDILCETVTTVSGAARRITPLSEE